MLPPELANPFERPPLVPLNPDTAGMVGDMLGPEAKKAFVALDDESPKPREKPVEPTEEEKAAMREAQKRLERSRERFPTWRTVPLGEYKTAEEFISALERWGFKIGNRAREDLEKIHLPSSPTSVELVKVSFEDLGLDQKVPLQEIYDRAIELGLSLCPAEVGPALRFHYPDQPISEFLLVATEPIVGPDDDLDMFIIEHDYHGRWLRTGPCHSGVSWNSDHSWIFFRSKQK